MCCRIAEGDADCINTITTKQAHPPAACQWLGGPIRFLFKRGDLLDTACHCPNVPSVYKLLPVIATARKAHHFSLHIRFLPEFPRRTARTATGALRQWQEDGLLLCGKKSREVGDGMMS